MIFQKKFIFKIFFFSYKTIVEISFLIDITMLNANLV